MSVPMAANRLGLSHPTSRDQSGTWSGLAFSGRARDGVGGGGSPIVTTSRSSNVAPSLFRVSANLSP